MKKGNYILFTLLGGFFVAVTLSAQNKDFALGKNLETFINVFRTIATNYVDEIDAEKTTTKAINAFLSSLDPYTEFYDEKKMKEFEVSTTGKYGGVGSLIRKHYTDSSHTQISQPYKNSPAAKAGLLPGDKIISIDGKNMFGVSLEQVSNTMRGDPGTSLKMVIAPVRDTASRKEVVIKRERIVVPSVDFYKMMNDSVGYISLQKFMENSSEEVRTAIVDLQSQGMKRLILDLRSNGGGLLDESVKISGFFVPKGSEIVSIKGRDKTENRVFKTNNEPIVPNMPLAVLVNSSSASASEIVAGALQDLDRAVIVGARTFGKGLVQGTISVGYGSYIKVTTAKYYIPSGRCIQALDYSHRNKDGSVGRVPDSLITEYKTTGGRKVYDGGGVKPDIDIKADTVSRYAAYLYMTGRIDDFALDYFARNHVAPDPKTFALTNKDWADFKNLLKKENVEYKSFSETNLKKFIESAKSDGYYNEIKPQIEAIERQIKSDVERDFERNRSDISQYLENAILTTYYFSGGGNNYMIGKDSQIKKSIELLSNDNTYRSALKHDTTK